MSTKLNTSEYIRTDLATESEQFPSPSTSVKEYSELGFRVSDAVFDDTQHHSSVGNGRYITTYIGSPWLFDRRKTRLAIEAVSALLKRLIKPDFWHSSAPVLTVCLGNRHITADAIGPLCADKIIVTRHLKNEKRELFDSLGSRELAVLSTGVTGNTGIEAFEMISACAKKIRPGLIICIDALTARSVDRLASTIQLSDAGISPGSGVGNSRPEISYKTLGIPVLSIGVPTVVQSSTLVYDALDKAGIKNLSRSLVEVLENEKSFFVTPKNTDVAVQSQAEIIAKAINRLFLGFCEL